MSGVNTSGSFSPANYSATNFVMAKLKSPGKDVIVQEKSLNRGSKSRSRGRGKSTSKVAPHDGNVDVGVGRKLFSPSNQPNGRGNKSQTLGTPSGYYIRSPSSVRPPIKKGGLTVPNVSITCPFFLSTMNFCFHHESYLFIHICIIFAVCACPF